MEIQNYSANKVLKRKKLWTRTEWIPIWQICAHHGVDADPDYPRQGADDTEIIQMVGAYIRKRLPHVEGDTPGLIESCFYTVSKASFNSTSVADPGGGGAKGPCLPP